MASWRERYFSDFTAEKRMKENGKGYKKVLIYNGKLCTWFGSPERLRAHKIGYTALALINAAVYFLTGLMDSPANSAGVVSIVALFAAGAYAFMALGIGQFALNKDIVPIMDYNDTNKKIIVAGEVNSALLAISSIAAVVYYFIDGRDARYLTVAAGYFFCAFCSAAIFYMHKRLKGGVVKVNDEGIVSDKPLNIEQDQ